MTRAAQLIWEADRIAKGKGLTQAEWSRKAGFDTAGVAISRTYKRGNCKLSTFVSLLEAIGYRVEIMEGCNERVEN